MGNINKRSSSRSVQTGAQWDEANVLRLISENKLAPKHSDSSNSRNNVECPICFLDYSVLNTVHCCKQMICTTCVVQLKSTEGKPECPFCGNAEMQVSLNPSSRNTSTHTTPSTTPVKAKDERSDSNLSDYDQPSSRSSGSGSVTLSYTTPEQEKKLRSHSLDATGSGGGSAVATKVDREALERQIREQRLQFDERDLEEAAARDRGPYFSGSGSGSSGARRFGGRSTINNNNSGAMRFGGRYRLANGAGSGAAPSDPAAASRVSEQDSLTSGDASRRFIGSFEELLQGRAGIGGISSIQQLEDIMLMEAIRLSMQDAGGAGAGAGAGDPQAGGGVDGSDANTSAAATGNTSASISQNTTLPNSSTDSRQTSPQRPASASAASTALRDMFNSASESHDSTEEGEEGEEEEEGQGDDVNLFSYHESGGERGEYRMSGSSSSDPYPGEDMGSRESDVLSEEEEQIKLAMALSLATVQPPPPPTTSDETVSPPSMSVAVHGSHSCHSNHSSAPDMIVMDRRASPGLPISPHATGLSPEASTLNLASCCSTPPEDSEPVMKMSADDCNSSSDKPNTADNVKKLEKSERTEPESALPSTFSAESNAAEAEMFI